MPAVSILIPCFNCVNTIREALGSIIEQTYQDIEIIAVDDGSDDGTLEILQQHAGKDNRLKVFSIPHQGIIGALNLGLEHCSAPYIARMDSDDLAHRERIELQKRYLEQHPRIGLVSSCVQPFPSEEVRGGFQVYINWLNSLVNESDIHTQIYIESPFPHPSVFCRTEIYRSLGGYQEHGWPEDYDLWLRMHQSGVRFAKIPEVLLYWREDPHRLTRTDSRYSLENFLRAKAHYLGIGPLRDRDAVFIWGAGMMGRRICKQLKRGSAQLTAFVDVNPEKIGGRLRGLPIISKADFFSFWDEFDHPILLSALGSQRARAYVRNLLGNTGLVEGDDWLCVA